MKIEKPSEFDLEHLLNQVRQNIHHLRRCKRHRFTAIAPLGIMFKCSSCGGEIEGHVYEVYLQGLRDGAVGGKPSVPQGSSDNESNFGDLPSVA